MAKYSSDAVAQASSLSKPAPSPTSGLRSVRPKKLKLSALLSDVVRAGKR